MTHITFTNVSRGSQYIVNVTAENIIGIGEESLITGKYYSLQYKFKIIIYIIVSIPIAPISSTSTSSLCEKMMV